MKQTLIKIAIFTLLLIIIAALITKLNMVNSENERLTSNQDILMSENNFLAQKLKLYKVSDSLNAVKVEALRLSLDEYKRYRTEDLALIKKLQLDKRDMQSVIRTQLQVIDSLKSPLHDTVIITNGHKDTVKVFRYRSEWTDVDGLIQFNPDSVALVISNRESLHIVESVRYKRFLGFLWKTKKVKSRDVDILSKNPNTKIVGASYEVIEK